MPRYFFHVEDGKSFPDHEGVELPDLKSARVSATKMFGGMLINDPETFWNGDEWTLKVAHEDGLVLFCIHFLASESPAGQATPSRPVSASTRPF